MGRALFSMSNSTTRLHSLFQRLGVAYSRENERRRTAKTCEELKENFLAKVKLNQFSYAIILFDNLGFKNRQGFRKGLGYEQYTIIKIVTVDEGKLKEIGVYG